MKNKHLFFFFGFFLALPLFFYNCSFNTEYTSSENKISLEKDWEYSLEDPTFGNAKFHPLNNDSLSNLSPLIPSGTGFIWLQKRFSIPQNLDAADLSVYLGRITMADITTVNGVFIGNEGRFPPNEFSAWNTTRLYSIPKEILHSDENILLVKIYVNGEGSIVSNPFISLPEVTKRASVFESFWNSKVHLLFAFLMLIIAGYHFLIYLKRTKEKENLLFAFINIISALYLSVFYLSEIPGLPTKDASFLWFQKIFSSALPFLFPFLVTSFINSFLKRKENKVCLILRIIFVVAPIIQVFFCKDYSHLRALRNLTMPLLVPPMLYILYILIVSQIKKNKDGIPLLLGFLPLVASVLLDVLLHDGLKLYNLPYFSSFGWQLVIIALLFILASRFANARTEAEDLNLHLENKVADRTKKLSESNEHLSIANEKLEDARQKAERDMKLAVYVQQSFYPRSAPIVDSWEIAYLFQPMSGVSGDLYDFYTKKNILQGLSLFDVSGHGIASGLVTMLSKTIIARKFEEGFSKPFSHVMKEINNSLIEEKGDIENYLTGVLLRINGNTIEYINAGHPEIFCRSARSGKVLSVELPGSSKETDSGGIIGIAGLEPNFKVMRFSFNSGDSLFLYTDCLSESCNKDGEQFGTARIANAFSSVTNGSANAKLSTVMNSFKAFTKGVPLNDDLTVIVLQKK